MSVLRRLVRGSCCVVLLAGFAGCGAEVETSAPAPAAVEEIEGSEVKKVILTEAAHEAVGIQTATAAVGAQGQVTLPYASVLYYLDGSTWTYTETAPLTYVRVPITVAGIDGETATLTEGPKAGTVVVTTGSPELLGAELEIDGEQ